MAEISLFKIFSHSCIEEKREILRITKNCIEINYAVHHLVNEFPVPLISLKPQLLESLSWSFNEETSEYLNIENEIVGKMIMWQDGNVFHKNEVIFQYAGIGVAIIISQQGYQNLLDLNPHILTNNFKVYRKKYHEQKEFDLTSN